MKWFTFVCCQGYSTTWCHAAYKASNDVTCGFLHMVINERLIGKFPLNKTKIIIIFFRMPRTEASN